MLDVFSRFVAGWMVAPREKAELAKRFIKETIAKHRIPAGQLNIQVQTVWPVNFAYSEVMRRVP
jgi:transposase InsO family protein